MALGSPHPLVAADPIIVSMPAPILEISGVRKRYGKTVALDGASLAVTEGEMFGLLGPNGAGKTTLISISCGLLAADSGEVRLFGKPFRPTDRDHRRVVGIGTQDLSIYPGLSARENLQFFGKLYGMGGRDLDVRVGELLAAVGLSDRADDRAGTFSGGMKRRLNLAVAVVHRPKLLFLDEPTTGVDPQSRNHIFEQVKALNAAGMTVVYTSHYMEEVEQLCTRIAILESGRVLACDTLPALLGLLDATIDLSVPHAPAGFADQLGRLPGVKAVGPTPTGFHLIVTDLSRALASVAVACAAAGAELAGVSTREPTLERVFLHLTGRQLRD